MRKAETKRSATASVNIILSTLHGIHMKVARNLALHQHVWALYVSIDHARIIIYGMPASVIVRIENQNARV